MGVMDEFYGSLQALGCVPCTLCDGSYMFPDHVEHRPLLEVMPIVVDASIDASKREPDSPAEPAA
jgi:hypothetical protein